VNILQGDKSPNSGETLAVYVKRIRISLGLNQRELAAMATIPTKTETAKTAAKMAATTVAVVVAVAEITKAGHRRQATKCAQSV
jgi:hypothetical protein